MKKYFNSADGIVLKITVISIFWIIGYKFFWFDMEPLFSNADKTADITYTICTSVVASGLFYLFTIFIPKYFLIRRMKQQLTDTIGAVISYIGLLVGEIHNSATINNYTIEEIEITIHNNDLSRLEADFVTYCNDNTNLNKLLVSNKFLLGVLSCISASYYRFLPDKTYNDIIELVSLHTQSIEVIKIFKPEEEMSTYFSIFKNIILVINDIRSQFDIKWWNNTMNMQIRF